MAAAASCADRSLPTRSMLQSTRRAGRRELAAFSEVPDWEELDHLNEVFLGTFMTLVGVLVILVSMVVLEVFVIKPAPGRGFLTIDEIKYQMDGREPTDVFAACTDEYGMVRASISCWVENSRDVFKTDKLAERAFFEFDCDRNFVIDDNELRGAFAADNFICPDLHKPSSTKPILPLTSSREAGLVMFETTTATSTTATGSSTKFVVDGEGGLQDVGNGLSREPLKISTTLTVTSTTLTTTPTTSTITTTPKPLTSEHVLVVQAPPLPTTTMAPMIGPLTVDQYRLALGHREHAGVEIIISDVAYSDLTEISRGKLQSQLIDTIAQKVGVPIAQIRDQKGIATAITVAGVGHNTAVACSVGLPYGMTLDQAKVALTSFESKQLIAAAVTSAVGKKVEHFDIMPWVDRGEDVADRLNAISPDEITQSDFLNYALEHMSLTRAQATSVFEALDKNEDQQLNDKELFV
mmetsp:Transcript_20149/g.51115  ORF Transcript_20149/g.51115 Transcript_20149/m.51115 type:complete len:466 (+) Transcript_20149:111-1508(+)